MRSTSLKSGYWKRGKGRDHPWHDSVLAADGMTVASVGTGSEKQARNHVPCRARLRGGGGQQTGWDAGPQSGEMVRFQNHFGIWSKMSKHCRSKCSIQTSVHSPWVSHAVLPILHSHPLESKPLKGPQPPRWLTHLNPYPSRTKHIPVCALSRPSCAELSPANLRLWCCTISSDPPFHGIGWSLHVGCALMVWRHCGL